MECPVRLHVKCTWRRYTCTWHNGQRRCTAADAPSRLRTHIETCLKIVCTLKNLRRRGCARSRAPPLDPPLVRDLILLTMWVLSPTVVVIFVQCIDCSGWAFCVTDGMLPTDFSLFISFTTGLRAYIHIFMTIIISKRCLPQPAKHYIQYSLLARHIIIWFLPAYLLHVLVFLGNEICCVLWLRKFCYYEQVVAIVGDHPYFEVVGMSKVR